MVSRQAGNAAGGDGFQGSTRTAGKTSGLDGAGSDQRVQTEGYQPGSCLREPVNSGENQQGCKVFEQMPECPE
jgi:hypothetical protein